MPNEPMSEEELERYCEDIHKKQANTWKPLVRLSIDDVNLVLPGCPSDFHYRVCWVTRFENKDLSHETSAMPFEAADPGGIRESYGAADSIFRQQVLDPAWEGRFP